MLEQGTANPICSVIYDCYFYAEICTEIVRQRFMGRVFSGEYEPNLDHSSISAKARYYSVLTSKADF